MMQRAWILLLTIMTLVPTTPAQRRVPTRGADFEAALVRCADVTQPIPLTNCGTDPLRWGTASINKQGKVQIKIFAAEPNAVYTAVYRSLNGSTERTLTNIRTNTAGNANVELTGFFRPNDVGAGTIILNRDSLVQFVTGFIIEAVEPDEITQPHLEAGLVRCSEVNQPTTLSPCGTDRLLEGRAEVEADVEGISEVEVQVAGAEPNTTYDVIFRSLDATTAVAIGTLTTDGRGRGKLDIEGVFSRGDVGAGNIVLRRNDLDQFITGFKVTQPTRGRR
jgi:hypothetical protein